MASEKASVRSDVAKGCWSFFTAMDVLWTHHSMQFLQIVDLPVVGCKLVAPVDSVKYWD